MSRRTTERVHQAAAAIVELGPDIALLQEIWRPVDARLLAEALGSRYQIVEGVPTGRFIRSSGLLALVKRESRWQAITVGFHPFDAQAPAWKFWEGDGLGNKGVQSIALERDDSRLVVLNTHLQSSYSRRAYPEIRSRQIAELGRVAEQTATSVPLIAAGDLNTEPGEATYAELARDWLDLAQTHRMACSCATHFLPDGREGGWIDYILARRVGGWPMTAINVRLLKNVRPDDPYSDHHGLTMTVSVGTRAAAGFPLAVLALSGGRIVTRRQWLRAVTLAFATPDEDYRSNGCARKPRSRYSK